MSSAPAGSASPNSFVLLTDLPIGAMLSRLTRAHPHLTVIVPIYNAAEAVKACLTALVKNTNPSVQILAINDASTQPEIAPLLTEFSKYPNVRVKTNPVNLGYTRTVNFGLSLASVGDVVLLNSDAEVGPLWLQRLRWVAYSADSIATVSAVSNHAGTMSIPIPHQNNDWHPRRAWDVVSRLVGRGMYVWSMKVPAAHGFCMYIRREALSTVGALDEQAFPRGYGEEVDYSQRALACGLENLVAPHVMIKHRRSQSFGVETRRSLVLQSREVLRRRHPRLESDVRRWESSVGDRLIRLIAHRLAHTMLTTCQAPLLLVFGAGEAASSSTSLPIDHTLRVDMNGDGRVTFREFCDGEHLQSVTQAHSADPVGCDGFAVLMAELIIRRGVEKVEILNGAQPDSSGELRAVASTLGIPVGQRTLPDPALSVDRPQPPPPAMSRSPK